MNTMKKILYVVRDEGGCGYYRCFEPANFLKRAGLFDTEAVVRKPSEAQLLSADLVIMQEMGSSNASNIGRYLVEKRIPFLTEFDDFVHHVSPNNVHGYGGWNPGTLMTHRAMELSRAAFGIQVSTPQMAREYFPYNPTIYVLPNWLDKDLWDIPVSRRGDGKVRIGWAGGNAHGDDLKMISRVMQDVIRDSKGKVVFETMGMVPQELHGVFPMPASPPDVCPSCGHEGELHIHAGEALHNYPLALASKGWDIALAPVINNAFGNCKSDLKLKEYCALGIPAVASDVMPYQEAVRAGCPVSLARTYEEWYTSIMKLVRSQKLRDETARKAKEWAKDKWMQDRVYGIADVYTKVINKAEAVLGTKEARLKALT